MEGTEKKNCDHSFAISNSEAPVASTIEVSPIPIFADEETETQADSVCQITHNLLGEKP